MPIYLKNVAAEKSLHVWINGIQNIQIEFKSVHFIFALCVKHGKKKETKQNKIREAQ